MLPCGRVVGGGALLARETERRRRAAEELGSDAARAALAESLGAEEAGLGVFALPWVVCPFTSRRVDTGDLRVVFL